MLVAVLVAMIPVRIITSESATDTQRVKRVKGYRMTCKRTGTGQCVREKLYWTVVLKVQCPFCKPDCSAFIKLERLLLT